MTLALPIVAVAAAAVAAGFRSRKPPSNPPMPDGWRRMKQAEVTPAHTAFAIECRRHMGAVGRLQQTAINGVTVAGRTEWHYHEPGGTMRPWGWHHGVSLLVPA